MADIDSSKLSPAPNANIGYDRKAARVGDWISRHSDLPSLTWLMQPQPPGTVNPITHHGVVVTVEGEEVGVCDLQMEGYRVVELAEFAAGKPVTLVRLGLPGQEKVVYDRFLQVVEKGQQWSLLWTCEDAAAFVHDGKSKGEQGMNEILAARDLGKAFGRALRG